MKNRDIEFWEKLLPNLQGEAKTRALARLHYLRGGSVTDRKIQAEVEHSHDVALGKEIVEVLAQIEKLEGQIKNTKNPKSLTKLQSQLARATAKRDYLSGLLGTSRILTRLQLYEFLNRQ